MKIDIQQLQFIDINLRQMAQWLEQETGLEFTITSLYRIGDKGVHGQLPLRGIDLRCRHTATGVDIATLINVNWEYDHLRPEMDCAILHGEGSNKHLHLQSHPNTRMRV